jgi:hypothetical protein
VNDDGLTDRRTILRVTGNTLSLSGIAKDVDPGDTVSVVLGCNHKAYAEQAAIASPCTTTSTITAAIRGFRSRIPIGDFNNYF